MSAPPSPPAALPNVPPAVPSRLIGNCPTLQLSRLAVPRPGGFHRQNQARPEVAGEAAEAASPSGGRRGLGGARHRRPGCHGTVGPSRRPRPHGERVFPSPQTPCPRFSCPQDLVPSGRRKRQAQALVEPLELSITLSPYAAVTSPLFLRSLRGGEAAGFWLSRQPRPGGSSVWDLQTKIQAE